MLDQIVSKCRKLRFSGSKDIGVSKFEPWQKLNYCPKLVCKSIKYPKLLKSFKLEENVKPWLYKKFCGFYLFYLSMTSN